MTDQNKTAQDAFSRLNHARCGSLVAPEHEYLEALRNGLYLWIREVENEIGRKLADETNAKAAAEESFRPDDDPEFLHDDSDHFRDDVEADADMLFRAGYGPEDYH